MKRPNLLFVLSDQHRGQATGYAGNPDVRTPNLDALARRSVVFDTAVSNIPVCTPARASLLTGQYPLTHRLIVNDIPLQAEAVHFAEALRDAGYLTGYIGKWHLAGGPWDAPIPADQRKGFAFWRACECTHDYFHSGYHGDGPQRRYWDGYDVFAQTREAVSFIESHAGGQEAVALFVSYGPPHDPYHPAPQPYASWYDPERLTLRPNAPEDQAARIRADLAGYYAHISAIDAAIGELTTALEEARAAEETILVYTSDHGDMLGSHGQRTKEKPWDESVRIPLVISCPGGQVSGGLRTDRPIGIVDLMPTVLDLCGIEIPQTVQGVSYGPVVRTGRGQTPEAVLIECIQPFGSWGKIYGGREYRGLRTARYTYVADRSGPWLLYDNRDDPYQLRNVCDDGRYADVRERLDGLLREQLDRQGDRFEAGETYMARFGYEADETGRVPIPPPIGN